MPSLTLKRALVTVAFGLPLAAIAPAAHASTSTLWASPGGGGTACTRTSPCSITEGVASLATGDTLRLLPGRYASASSPLTTSLAAPADSTIIGVKGAFKTLIYSKVTGNAAISGWNVQGLAVFSSGSDNGIDVQGDLDHVAVHDEHASDSAACYLEGTATAEDSLCIDHGKASAGLTGAGTDHVRGVTAIGDGIDGSGLAAVAGSGGGGQVIVTNTIAKGTSVDILAASLSSSFTAKVVLDHSNFERISTGSNSDVITNKTDVLANPRFTDPSKSNFTETAKSPTINRGAKDASGDTDLAGRPRSTGGRPDIGAFEFVANKGKKHHKATPAIARMKPTYEYVDPTGAGTACTDTAPCSIEQAFSSSTVAAFDHVILEPGDYGSPTTPIDTSLSIGENSYVYGEPGKPAPTIYSDAGGSGLTGWSFSHFDVVYSGTGAAVGTYLNADHLNVTSTGSIACEVNRDSIRDSLCVDSDPGGVGLAITPYLKTDPGHAYAITAKGVTALSTAVGGDGVSVVSGYEGGTDKVLLTNDIAKALAGGSDVYGHPGHPTAAETIVLTNCDAKTFAVHDAGTTKATYTTSHDVTAAPEFTSTPRGNFTEQATSPTVNRGAPAGKGDTDLAGNPRTLGKAPDIGAYEFVQPPTVAGLHTVGWTERSVTVRARVDPEGLPTHVVASVGAKTADTKVIGDQAKPVTLTVRHIPAHGDYTIQMEATNAGGGAAAGIHATRH